MDGGGATGLTAGNYTLSGIAGQPDAGAFSAGTYDLAGGFWAGIINYLKNFMPLVKK